MDKRVVTGEKVKRVHRLLKSTETDRLRVVLDSQNLTVRELQLVMGMFGMGRRRGRKDVLAGILVCHIEKPTWL